MTAAYTGDCCPACGSYYVIPYALILGSHEEYGYHCQTCQITWRVLTCNGDTTAAAGTGSSPR